MVSPVTTPLVVILAVPVPGVIDHVPPTVASVKAGVVAFTQTVVAPPETGLTTGNGFTVKVCVDELVHPPVTTVYTTLTVPADNPVTMPPVEMLAVPDPGVIDQVPPAVASVKAGVFAFTHTDEAPSATGATVTVAIVTDGVPPAPRCPFT